MAVNQSVAPGRWWWRPFRRAIERLPMMKTLDGLYAVSPGLGRFITRLWYQQMTRLDKHAEMTFMNYGFADDFSDGRQVVLHLHDEGNRYCIQLYHHVAAAVDLEGKDVLEVGCGRGGGASYIARYLKPRSVAGLDIAPKAVEFCRRHYPTANLSFECGDAEALPFADASFDAVVNVESSHCYASMAKFLAEVRRTLRPGGWFLFADRRDRGGMDTLRGQLRTAGFDIISESRITGNIVRALELDDARKQALIHRGVPWFLRNLFRQFAATTGTSLYKAFDKGAWEYHSFVLRRARRPQRHDANRWRHGCRSPGER
jgi:SAM-dependent methyltransferase